MAMRSTSGNSLDLFRNLSNPTESRFRELFLENYKATVLYTYRITDDEAAAEDIVTEVFVNLWKRNEGFDQIQSIKSYIYTSARNRALSWIKTNKREKDRKTLAASLEEVSESPVIDNMIYAETMVRVYAAIELLPQQCRKVFIMHYIEGKKIAEIAIELNISISSVRTHRGRGIELLRKGLLGLLVYYIFSFA